MNVWLESIINRLTDETTCIQLLGPYVLGKITLGTNYIQYGYIWIDYNSPKI
jgi:hypothetical protein